MPDLYTHWQFGKKVLEVLPESVKIDKEIFLWAQEGPDIWSFWKPWSRVASNKRSHVMHTDRAYDFVKSLLQQDPDNTLLFSYAMGFLCHIIYDNAMHRYIDNIQAELEQLQFINSHVALERAYDIYLMKMEYDTPTPFVKMKLPHKWTDLKHLINLAYEVVFGWKQCSRQLTMLYRFHPFYYFLFWDRLGVMYGAGRLLGNRRLIALSYYRKDILDKRICKEEQACIMKIFKSIEEITHSTISETAQAILEISQLNEASGQQEN